MNNAITVEESALVKDLMAMEGKFTNKEVRWIAVKAERDHITIKRYFKGMVMNEEWAQRLLNFCEAFLALKNSFKTQCDELQF